MKVLYLHHAGTYQTVSGKAEGRWFTNSRGKKLHSLALAPVLYPGPARKFKTWDDFKASLLNEPDPPPSTAGKDAIVLFTPDSYFPIPASGAISFEEARGNSALDYQAALNKNGLAKAVPSQLLQGFAFRMFLVVMLLFAVSLASIGISAAIGGD